MKLKFQMMDDDGLPLPLMSAERIMFEFKTSVGDSLRKIAEILDHEKSIVLVQFTDANIQRMAIGAKQDCVCKVYMQNADEYTALFSNAFDVQMVGDRKVLL